MLPVSCVCNYKSQKPTIDRLDASFQPVKHMKATFKYFLPPLSPKPTIPRSKSGRQTTAWSSSPGLQETVNVAGSTGCPIKMWLLICDFCINYFTTQDMTGTLECPPAKSKTFLYPFQIFCKPFKTVCQPSKSAYIEL